MKKYLMTGMAAMLFCGVFTSCSHDIDFEGEQNKIKEAEQEAAKQKIQEAYEQAFIARFGTPAKNQDWGFGNSQTTTRAAVFDVDVPSVTEVGLTFNATLAEQDAKIWNSLGSLNGADISEFEKFRPWDVTADPNLWTDKLYRVNATVKYSTLSDDYLAQQRDIILNAIPEGINNLAQAIQTGYTITTNGGPVTLTPIHHISTSGDLISYYFYPKGDTPPSEAEIKALPKYTIGYIIDPEDCKENPEAFDHVTYSLVYVDANGNASYNFPPNYEIAFIISNVDYKYVSPTLSIFDHAESGYYVKRDLPNHPEFYGDGRMNKAIHSANIGWQLDTPETPHVAVFSINDKNYIGFEDWIDLDFNDVIIEVTGTGGGTPIPGDDIDEWEEIRVIAEDLSVGQSTDFDFNDVVFDVRRYTKTTTKHNEGYVEIILRAAGGTLPLYVDGHEVHEAFGVDVSTMVNTGAQAAGLNGKDDAEPVTFKVENPQGSNIGEIAKNIPVYVIKNEIPCYLLAPIGEIASKIGVDCDYVWCTEREDIDHKYSLIEDGTQKKLFTEWVQGIFPASGWYNYAKGSIEEYKAAKK